MNIITQNYTTKTSLTSVALAIVTLTEKSIVSAKEISKHLDTKNIFVMSKHKEKITKTENMIFYEKLSQITKEIFYNYDAIIFIMATGIVIRHIAPYVNDKTTDPAVIVCDEKLDFAISLLSGHIGGANKLCLNIAEKTNITPVITTATDVNKKGALDNIALSLNAFDNDDRDVYKEINYKLANDEKIYFLSDINIDTNIDLKGFTLIQDTKNVKKEDTLVHITYSNTTNIESIYNYKKIVPKKIVLGIGCRKNTDVDLLEKTVYEYLKEHNISKKSILTIGSIDLKKDEQAIIKLSNNLNCNFIVFSSEEIKSSKHYNTIPDNEFVSSITGVNSVSLATAKILSDDNIIGTQYKNNGITIAMGIIK